LTYSLERWKLARTVGVAAMDTTNRAEVDRNYEAFLKLLPTIIAAHANKYVLMHDGAPVGYYTTLDDAYTTAHRFLSEKPFTVQKVTDAAVDLGFFSHAIPIR
jgi:hypothetical protein